MCAGEPFDNKTIKNLTAGELYIYIHYTYIIIIITIHTYVSIYNWYTRRDTDTHRGQWVLRAARPQGKQTKRRKITAYYYIIYACM